MQLFSGMRNKEILNLKADDLKVDEDSGVLYFFVKGSKTANTTRRIPVHKYLIERSVVDYIKSNNGSNTSSAAISMIFTKLLKKLEINNINAQGHLLSFYSLRHNFMTVLVGSGATDTMINSIVGHAQEGAKNAYINAMQIDLQALDNVIQKVS